MDNKMCGRCKIVKDFSEFAKNKSRKFGIQSTCKECFNEIYGQRSPETLRSRHVRQYYGIEWDDYKAFFEVQEGKCLICGCDILLIGDKNIKNGAHVDHDHETGEFRALLCHACNAGLGYFQDSVEITKKAYEYLEYFKHKK